MVAPERSPAQVPENQHNNQNTSAIPGADEAAEARFTHATLTSDKDPSSRRNKILAGVGALAAVGLTALGVGMNKMSNDVKDIKEHLGAEPVATASLDPTTEVTPTISGNHEDPYMSKYDINNNGILDKSELETMAPEDYAGLGIDTIANDLAESFTQHLESGWNTIKDTLNSDEHKVLSMPDLHKPRAEWTGQDYLNYQTIALWLTTRQSNQEDSLRALSAIVDPAKNLYQNTVRWIEANPGVGMKAVYEADSTYLNNIELSNIQVGDVSVGPEGGRLVGNRSLIDGSVNYTLFVNTPDEKGNVVTTNAYTYDSLENPDLQYLIELYNK